MSNTPKFQVVTEGYAERTDHKTISDVIHDLIKLSIELDDIEAWVPRHSEGEPSALEYAVPRVVAKRDAETGRPFIVIE